MEVFANVLVAQGREEESRTECLIWISFYKTSYGLNIFVDSFKKKKYLVATFDQTFLHGNCILCERK